MDDVSQLESLSLTDLEAHCRKQTQNYLHGRKSDSRYCWEIFRRALQHEAAALVEATAEPSHRHATAYRDEDARAVLVHLYTPFIEAHISPAIARVISRGDLVQQVWMHFWQAANHGLNFPSLEAALTYLKQATVSTAIIANRRERRRRLEEPLQHESLDERAGTDDQHDPLFDQYVRQRFRARCREVLTDALEYRVFWMRYALGYAPRDIARRLGDEGLSIRDSAPTARSVSDLLERSCRHLRNDPEIRDLLAGD